MSTERPTDSGTLRIFVVLGLLTLMAVIAINWALNAPLGGSSPASITLPASK